MKKMDLRVKRTQKMIFQAFTELVAKKGYDAVTIQEIADLAMINRATFYAHYKDKQDLYEQILKHFIKTFTSIIDTSDSVSYRLVRVVKIQRLLTSFFTNVKENQNFVQTIINGSNGEILQQKFSEVLNEKYDSIFSNLLIKEQDMVVPVDFIIEYMTGIFTSTLKWWIHSKNELTAEQLAQLVIKLIGNGHLTVLGIEIER